MTEDTPTEQQATRVIFVTGVSGAGMGTALKALEDLGYEAIYNLPLELIEPVLTGDGATPAVAIGVDIRSRGFEAAAFLAQVEALAARPGLVPHLLYVDCDDHILVRRFEETRRRHPLATDCPIGEAIGRERQLMAPLRDGAEIIIDTSEMKPGDMKPLLEGHFAKDGEAGLAVFVTSFGFKNGLPRDVDLVFDVRFLRNPHYVDELRPLTGRDPEIAAYVAEDAAFQPFFESLTGLLMPLLPRYAAEGKSYLTIAMGCAGGRHRSVFTAEKLADWLDRHDQPVHLSHRDLENPVK